MSIRALFHVDICTNSNTLIMMLQMYTRLTFNFGEHIPVVLSTRLKPVLNFVPLIPQFTFEELLSDERLKCNLASNSD